MRLNKIEKIVVAVILLGLILIGGTFLLVVPSFNRIEPASKELASNIAEKAALDERLSRLDTIDGDIDTSRKDAVKYEGGFYPDLTTYEASEIAMALMKAHNLDAHTISLTNLATNTLSLEYYSPSDVEYDLKTYSETAKEVNEDDALVYGEFKDGNKIYSINVNSFLDAQITDENGEAVDPSRYTDTMKKVYKAAICRLASEENIQQTVGKIDASYTVKGRYADYMAFIDDMYKLDRATTFSNIIIPMTTTINEEEDSEAVFLGEDGSIQIGSQANNDEVVVEDDTEIEETLTISFLTVEPMNKIKTVDAGGESIVVDQRPTVY